MKRRLIVDYDDERKEGAIMIGPIAEHENQKMEAKPLLDMGILCEAVCTLIHICNKKDIKKDSDSLKDCIEHLKKGFMDETYKVKVKK